MIKSVLRRAKKLYEKYFSRYGVINGWINYLVSYTLQYKKIQHRRKQALRYKVNNEHRVVLQNLRKEKFLKVSTSEFSNFEHVEEILKSEAVSVRGLNIESLKKLYNQTSEKSFWADIFPKNRDKQQQIYKFFLNQEILSIVGNYLEEMPYLESVCFFYSPASQGSIGSASQLWHKDRDQYNKLKIFYSPFGTSEQNGCTKIFQHKVGKFHTYPNYPWYFSDDDARRENWPLEKIVNLELSSSELAMVDTGILVHKGADRQALDRFLLIATYGGSASRLKVSDWKQIQVNSIII